jgi:formate-dependent nitrite reductase membrane component NrfD
LLINIFLIVCYLISVNYTSAVSKISISELTTGRTAVPFWGGLILVGLIIPAAISIVSLFGAEASSVLLIIAVICHTAGAFALKYCLLKVGIYRPLLPRFAAY